MNMRQEVIVLCVTLCLAASFIGCSGEDDYSGNNAHVKAYHDGVPRGISRRINYVTIDEYPFIAQVIKEQDNEYLCGGSLISDHHVMIPASCITDKDNTMPAEEIFVILGSDRFSKNGVIYGVSNVYVHPQYNCYVVGGDYLPANDIAVLVLENNVTMTENIVPIDYALKKDWESEDLSKCESLVWLGRPELDRKGRMGLIYSNITESAMCHEESSVRESRTYFCASSPSPSYCNQDLGMPIICNEIVFGMNKGIGRCDDDGTDELFINVTDTFVDDVINDNIKEKENTTTKCNNSNKKIALLPILIAPTLTNSSDLTFRDELKISGSYSFSLTNTP